MPPRFKVTRIHCQGHRDRGDRPDARDRREQPTDRIDLGREMARICCCKFVARSTTAHSVPGLSIDLTGCPMPTWPLPKRHDPPDLWTVPEPNVAAQASTRFPSATVSPRLAISSRSSGGLIVMTSTNGASPSAPIFTSLTIQTTRPSPVRLQTRKYRSGPRTPNLRRSRPWPRGASGMELFRAPDHKHCFLAAAPSYAQTW